MMRLVVLLCAIICLVHGTCTPWNGSPITSGTIFQLYHPFTNLWITNRAVPPYNNVQGLALSVAQSTAFYYNSVSGFSYSGAVGVQGVMSSYEGHSFTCSYGGNEFSTCPSGQSPAWKLAIVANGAAPTVRLWTSQMTGSFGWQLGVKQDYQNTLWMNLNRVEDFHLYICDSILQYQTIYPGHSLVLGPIFSFTQSAIIKFTTNGGTGRIFDKITAGTSDGWLLDVLGGKYRAILGNNVFTYTFPNAYAMPAVPLNQYQFVTFAYNHISGWGHLFVNGQWYNSLWSPNMAPNNLPWRVGIASDGSNSFPGTIERARFYWTLLGDGDVLADFNRAASETGYTFAPVTL